MGSIKRDGNNLVITMEITKVLGSPVMLRKDNHLVDAETTFGAAFGNLAWCLAKDKAPKLVGKAKYTSAKLSISEDKESLIIIFGEKDEAAKSNDDSKSGDNEN